MIKTVQNELAMKALGESIAKLITEGIVIELVGDVGAGKTTFVKGLAKGMGVSDEVQSPSFTISRVYDCNRGLRLVHYDFYRLDDAGVISNEIQEDIDDPNSVIVVEWGGVIEGVLPTDRLTIEIKTISDEEREAKLIASGDKSNNILERFENVSND